MDKADRGKTGLRSHLETTASLKRRHGAETCDVSVQSRAKARIKVWEVLYIYNEIASAVLCPWASQVVLRSWGYKIPKKT